jgi:osmotically-inducible protein OsmY
MRNTLVQVGIFSALLLSGAANADKNEPAPAKNGRPSEQAESMGHKAKQETKDEALAAKTKIALLADARTSASPIMVEAKKGVVVLRGKVPSDAAKNAAVEVAQGVEGEKEVRPELVVVFVANRAPVEVKDDAIIAGVKDKLAKDKLTKGNKIDVRSESGTVTLTGEVPTLNAAAAASEQAASVTGVRSVKNALIYKTAEKY